MKEFNQGIRLAVNGEIANSTFGSTEYRIVLGMPSHDKV